MVEVIESGEPALMVCHWPGIYYNGNKLGFNIFKTVVNRLEQKYQSGIIWMKLSEIAQYWAAKEFVKFEASKGAIAVDAPFGTKDFTISLDRRQKSISVKHQGSSVQLQRVSDEEGLTSQTFFSKNDKTILCFSLSPGTSEIRFT
jgi:hypothetical protein